MKLFACHPPPPFATSYVLSADGNSSAVLVDPGYFDTTVLGVVERDGLQVVAVLLTHAHPAHAEGLKTVLKIYPAAVFAAQAPVVECETTCLGDGDRFQAAGLQFEVCAIPGHSPDSLAYLVEGHLFSGDALSAGEVGRTASSDAAQQQAEALDNCLARLPAATLVMPGHGPPSSVEIERTFNPAFNHASDPAADPAPAPTAHAGASPETGPAAGQ
jgi:hydroxyacylglutathione hydrolase